MAKKIDPEIYMLDRSEIHCLNDYEKKAWLENEKRKQEKAKKVLQIKRGNDTMSQG
jgi:hypothetical protein